MSKKWSPAELLPKAEEIARLIIACNNRITGVAITGSLARVKPAGDIDLVVLHDGTISEGLARLPLQRTSYYSNSLELSSMVSNSNAIIRAAGEVPLDLIFVNQKVLWDCDHLKHLESVENFPEFYKRVFCDLPLLLLNWVRGELHNFVVKQQIEKIFYRSLPDHALPVEVYYIKHFCDNDKCKPVVSWEECMLEIEKRKARA